MNDGHGGSSGHSATEVRTADTEGHGDHGEKIEED
jgi:hypothetical protein